MSLTLRVTWPNAKSALLQGADIQAEGDDLALLLTKTAEGVREFDVPDGTKRVVVKAKFTASFGAVNLDPQPAAPPMSEVVLDVEQPYDIVEGGTKLQPLDIPAYGKTHPLVDTKVMANRNGVALVQIRTEFVNITPFWFAYADASKAYPKKQPGIKLVALACTRSEFAPLIWFASIPDACAAPPSPRIGCLVFFRPVNPPGYSRVNQRHNMFGLNRFLLKSEANPPPNRYWASDKFTVDPGGDAFFWLPCGFEDALVTTGKAVVMLHPWPSGGNFGSATSSLLPSLAQNALLLLWAQKDIGKGLAGVELGRFGIAGYSFGGQAMWSALKSNSRRISELYSFDANHTDKNAPHAINWFFQRDDNILRMSGGYQITNNEAIRRAITGKSPGAASRVTSTPPNASAYTKPGGNVWWDYVLTDFPDGKDWAPRKDGALWHQFAVFGGHGPSAGANLVTFMKEFLSESRF